VSAPIELSISGHVAELRLNRPERRNAMTAEMGAAVTAAVAELNENDEVRAVIVCGAGDAFSSGGDFSLLAERAASSPDENRRAMRAFYDSFLSIRNLAAPSIAAIHGHALGAGLCFALGCDLRIAAADAKLGVTFVRVALHPGMGATHLLERAVGAARAAELLLTGRVIDADEALRMGLVSAVHPVAELAAAARRLADELAAHAPVALKQTKATLRETRTLNDALDREADCQAVDYATADLAESIAAFRDKRKPVYRGR
jgi:enoyl-CoA hydratase